MRLEAKLALFNALSKLLLVLLGALVIPPVGQRVAVAHTDEHLQAKRRQVLALIRRDGLATFLRTERGELYANYNILQQEYIRLTLLPAGTAPQAARIFEERREVDKEVEDFRILSAVVAPVRAGERPFQLEIGSSLATVELLTATLRRLALWVLVAGALLTVLTDAAFAHHLLRPLRELLARKLRSIRSPAEFSFAALPTSTADFQELDASLNSLMRQLQAAFDKEREFMSNVSHELLTPASILESRFENLLQDPTLPEAHARQIVESQHTLYRLRNTVRTLLLIANIEKANYLRQDRVSLARTVAEAAEELDERRAARHLDLEVDLSPDFVLPQANATLLHTLLRNLLANAIKYNHDGGRIRVRGRPLPLPPAATGAVAAPPAAGYELRVEDTGPGIAAEHLPYLFDRFRRFQQAGPGAPEGYGLGLPIAQTIATFHGATLGVESVVGQGSTFVLTFGESRPAGTSPPYPLSGGEGELRHKGVKS